MLQVGPLRYEPSGAVAPGFSYFILSAGLLLALGGLTLHLRFVGILKPWLALTHFALAAVIILTVAFFAHPDPLSVARAGLPQRPETCPITAWGTARSACHAEVQAHRFSQYADSHDMLLICLKDDGTPFEDSDALQRSAFYPITADSQRSLVAKFDSSFSNALSPGDRVRFILCLVPKSANFESPTQISSISYLQRVGGFCPYWVAQNVIWLPGESRSASSDDRKKVTTEGGADAN